MYIRSLASACIALGAVSGAVPLAAAQTPLGTTFTYQGRLDSGGSPANGLFDLRFRLYDALTGGTQVGTTVCADNVSVTDGLFTFPIDFGPQFAGQERFLEIDVRADAGVNCASAAGFVTLAPRQPLTATPYAVFALAAAHASNADLLNGQAASFYQNASNLNAGTINVARLPNPLAIIGANASLATVLGQNNAGALQSTGVFGIAAAPTGFTNGVRGDAISPDGVGVLGFNGTTSGATTGVLGVVNAQFGRGVVGWNQAASGLTTGVHGLVHSPSGRGVLGESTSTDAVIASYGVIGISNSPAINSAGVRGINNSGGQVIGVEGVSTVGMGTGVVGRGAATGGYFVTDSASGRAVYGEASYSDGGLETNYGGYFLSSGLFGNGIYAETTTTEGSAIAGYFKANSDLSNAVLAVNDAATGIAVAAAADGNLGTAVFGRCNGSHGTAIQGDCSGVFSTAIFGESTGANGLGVFGIGERYGTQGRARSSILNSAGVYGQAFTGQTIGVRGQAAGTFSAGVTGTGYTGGYFETTVGGGNAGWFQGIVHVTGELFKGGGGFKIDHPLDPENKYLYHSFVESPDMKNIYDGNIVTDDDGNAVVQLPEWFEVVNKDFRYQLTVIGQFAQAVVAEEIHDNSFTIQTDKPRVKVSWQVTGIRKDPFAEQNRIPVEQAKEEHFRGFYLHPEAYGEPRSRRISLFDRELKQGS